ncbi:MAG: hypothetical protein ACHQZQ_02970 [SAR324 cluster bacterium]
MPLTLLKSLLPWGSRLKPEVLAAPAQPLVEPSAEPSQRLGVEPTAPSAAEPAERLREAQTQLSREAQAETASRHSQRSQAVAAPEAPARHPSRGSGQAPSRGSGQALSHNSGQAPPHNPGQAPSPRNLHRGGADAPHILPAAQLGIRQAAIHPHVLYICQTLHRRGHKAYVVGGAVRDLILGRRPKDFDIVTGARPEEVRAVFRNARIIGRRFRLCLLRFGDMKVEVSTFRGLPRRGSDGMIRRDNTYGTPREDAFRRDFTCNALALDPIQLTIVDHVGGLADLKARHIRTIAPPAVSFSEDPVRMLRAIRFQLRLGFSLDAEVAHAIRRQAETLRQVTRHRLADEAQRFLTAGLARSTLTEFERYGLLRPLLGLEDYGWFFDPAAVAHPLTALGGFLERLDRWSAEGPEPLPPTVVLLGLLVTLARPEFRAYLAPAPARGSVPGSPLDARTVRRFKRELPPMLLEWGLLRGQVVPALSILGAARLLLRSAHKAGGAGRKVHRAPRIGEREAWLLLGIVGPDLGADLESVKEGLARLHELPDLPILDHPRPAKHGTPKRAALSSSLSSGQAPSRSPGQALRTERSPDASRGPARRRKRRRRSAPGRQAVVAD